MISSRNRTTTKQTDNDRAVSDMIAFMLVFATIIGSVALLSTFGMQAMTDYQEGEQLQNAERAMISLSDNFDDVLRHDGIKQRYGELSLREGTITTGNSGTLVTITDEDDNELNKTDLGTFAYRSDSTTIAYEGGSVVRSEGGGSVVLKQPQLMCNPGKNGTAVISLIDINSDNRSIQSNGGIGVTMTETDRNRTVYTGTGPITIEKPETEYDGAWNSIRKHGDWDNGTCNGIDRAVVTIVTVNIGY